MHSGAVQLCQPLTESELINQQPPTLPAGEEMRAGNKNSRRASFPKNEQSETLETLLGGVNQGLDKNKVNEGLMSFTEQGICIRKTALIDLEVVTFIS